MPFAACSFAFSAEASATIFSFSTSWSVSRFIFAFSSGVSSGSASATLAAGVDGGGSFFSDLQATMKSELIKIVERWFMARNLTSPLVAHHHALRGGTKYRPPLEGAVTHLTGAGLIDTRVRRTRRVSGALESADVIAAAARID